MYNVKSSATRVRFPAPTYFRSSEWERGHCAPVQKKLYNVKNPIIIDQNYCDKAKPCGEQKPAVQVSNVVFKNIRGTTITKDAIKMNCSKNVPCQDITLQNIDLKG
jgi:hypothetical protein